MNLPREVFCDTSFFYACLDPSDANHEAASGLVQRATEARTTFTATWDIISESATLLRYRAGFRAAETFLTTIVPALDVADYDDKVRRHAEDVFLRFGRDRRLSYCDALSYAVVRLQLEDMPCLAFDRDFLALGLTVIR